MRLPALLRYPLAKGLIACLIGILAAQGAMRNFVLCRGLDGHISIEASPETEGTCGPQSNPQTKLSASLGFRASECVPASHCGPCRDSTLAHADSLYARLRAAQSQSGRTTLAPPQSGLVLLAKLCIQTVGRFSPRRQPATLSAPLHLRSTLLLI